MAATSAMIGYGTILKKGDGGGPEAFADWGVEITSTTAPGTSRDAIEATHMQSPDGYAEFIPGLKRATQFTLEINFDPSVTPTIVTAVEAAIGNWQILFPDATTVTFAAIVTSFEIGGVTSEGKMTASIAFQPSGKPVWA